MYAFLSAEWVDAVRAIRDEFRAVVEDQLAYDGDPVAVNIVVTDMPGRGPDVHAHAAVGGDGTAIDLGHRDDASIVVSLDYQTARHAVVDQDIKAIVRGFLFGRIAIKGDLAGLLGEAGGDPAALLSAFDLSGVSTIGDMNPMAAEIAERIRAVTL